MKRLLFKFDEILESDIDTQEKVLNLVLEGEVSAFIKSDNLYSVVQDYVGERINNPDNYYLYKPVKQDAVIAFQVDKDSINSILRTGEAICQYFDGGIGFDDQNKLVKYATIIRNYIPGSERLFCDSEAPEHERRAIVEGGVYKFEERDSKFDLECFHRESLPGIYLPSVNVASLYKDHPLTGFNAFSNQLIRVLVNCTRTYDPRPEVGPGPVIETEPGFALWSRSRPIFKARYGNGLRKLMLSDMGVCYRSILWHLKYEMNLFVPYLMLGKNSSWMAKKDIEFWRYFEILPDLKGAGFFLRSTFRYEYKLCRFSGGSEIGDGAKLSTVPVPEKIKIGAADLFFLADDREVLLDAIEVDIEADIEKISFDDSVRSEVPKYKDIKNLDRYGECQGIAKLWIRKLAKVEEDDLSGSDRLVDFLALAIWAWGETRSDEKMDDGYCRELIGGFPLEHPSYSVKLARMVRVRSQRTSNFHEGGRSQPLVKKSEEVWKESAISVLVLAWKKYVFDRSKTVKREKRRKWDKGMEAFFDQNQLDGSYVKAVASVILSDQDKENLFE